MNRHIRQLSVAMVVIAVASAAAAANVIEFGEPSPLPQNLAPLAGTSIYAPEGISLAGATGFVSDARFVGAGSDAYGITTVGASGTTPVGIVQFNQPVSSLTVDGLAVTTDFIADVYDGNTLLSTFIASANPTGTLYVSHTFTGHITKLDFHDHGGYVGIGRITTVPASPTPEPGAVVAAPILAGALMLRRKS